MTQSVSIHDAGPAQVSVIEPTAPRQRAATIDALRGVAILGILLLNVRNFALPGDAYVYPFVVEPRPGDLLAYALTTIFAQGKFIATFAALYGAGIVLSTRRLDEAGAPAFGRFLRRSLILAGVGLAHMFLVWPGDILFMYATLGLIAFTMRRWRPRSLWLMAGGVFLAAMAFQALAALGLWAGATFDQTDPSLTPAARAESWMLIPDNWRTETAAHTAGHSEAVTYRLTAAPLFQFFAFALFGPQVLALMLAGMALLKLGFLAGDWTGRRYVWFAVIGLLVGFGASGIVTLLGWRSDFTPIFWFAGGQGLLSLFAPLAALGISAAVVGLARHGGAIASLFAPVGRMAFTNYLSQSLLGTAIFHGWGLGFYGTGYARQLLAVLAIWTVNVLFSHLWLARFRYGPLEWLWRWATYGKRPQLRTDAVPLASSP